MKNLFIGIDFSKEKYCCPIKLFRTGHTKSGLAPIAGVSPFWLLCFYHKTKQPWAKVIILVDRRSRKTPKWMKRFQKAGGFYLARHPIPRPSPRFSTEGLGNRKNRLDHRENDSRAVSSCVCQLLSDSNNIQLSHNLWYGNR